MKPKTRKAKSLGQVAYEAHWPTALFPWDIWNNKPAWHRVARAVVKEHEKRLWAKAASGNGSTWTVKNRNR